MPQRYGFPVTSSTSTPLRSALAVVLGAVLAVTLVLAGGHTPPAAAATAPSTTQSVLTWTDAGATNFPYLRDVKKIQIGIEVTWALLKSGEVIGWGSNETGILGRSVQRATSTPVTVFDRSSVIDIAMDLSGQNGFLVLVDGSVLAIGKGESGLLGRSSDDGDAKDFVRIPNLTRVSSVAAGGDTAYAVRKDGSLYAWGVNTGAATAANMPIRSDTPVQVPIDEVVTSVHSAGPRAYAVTRLGHAWSWGSRFDEAALGTGGGSESHTPRLIDRISNIKTIAAGPVGAYALLKDGSVHSWGSGQGGALGFEQEVTWGSIYYPTEIPDLSGVRTVAIAAGYAAGYAVLADGTVKSWGDGSASPLGNNQGGATPRSIDGLRDVSMIAVGYERGFAVAAQQTPAQTRPLLLLHGITDSGRDMAAAARTIKLYVPGVSIETPDLQATGSIRTNAHIIIQKATELLEESGADKVNVIAHSKGGLDTREAMRLRPDLFGSLSMIGTPNGGSTRADVLCSARAVGSDTKPEFGECESDQDGLQNLTTAAIQQRNAAFPDWPGSDISVSAGNCSTVTPLTGVSGECLLPMGNCLAHDSAVCVSSAFAVASHHHIEPVFGGYSHGALKDLQCPVLRAVAEIYPTSMNPTNPWQQGSCSEPGFTGASSSGTAQHQQVDSNQPQGGAATQRVLLAKMANGVPLQLRVDGEGTGSAVVSITQPTDSTPVTIAGQATVSPQSSVTDALMPWTTRTYSLTDIPTAGADMTLTSFGDTETLIETFVTSNGQLVNATATRVSDSEVKVSVEANDVSISAGALTVESVEDGDAVAMTVDGSGKYSAQIPAPRGRLNAFVIRLTASAQRTVVVQELAPAQSVVASFPSGAALARRSGSINGDVLVPLKLVTNAATDAGPAHIRADFEVNGTTVTTQVDLELLEGETLVDLALAEEEMRTAAASTAATILPKLVSIAAVDADGASRPLAEWSSFPALPSLSLDDAPSDTSSNVALDANATASSENTADGQGAAQAVDSVIDGYPGNSGAEWASTGGGDGAWIQLDLGPTPVTVNRVVLHDRPNPDDRITSGTLTFSDGTTVPVGALANDGGATEIRFTPRATTSIRLTINTVGDLNNSVGLAEFEVWTGTEDLGPDTSERNVAPFAVATASSQDWNLLQTADNVHDGVVDGYPNDDRAEWASTGEGDGAWIQLDLGPTPVTVNRVVLHDRPNPDDRITSGTLTFSDGTTVPVGALANDGGATEIRFTPRATTSIRLTINTVSASTQNVGLAEWEVWTGN